MQHYLSRLLIIVLVGLLIIGCGAQPAPAIPTATSTEPPAASPTPTMTPVPATETPLPPTATDTPEPPTLTSTATEIPASSTPTATPQPTETPTRQASGGVLPWKEVPNSVKIYLLYEGTNGPYCGYRLLGVGTNIPKTGNVKKDLAAGLKLLFSLKSKHIAGFYNPLAISNIRVAEVDFEKEIGNIIVLLRGEYTYPEDKCDNTRVWAQVWSTVKQFPEIKGYDIYLNNGPFIDRLSNDR